MKYLYAAYVVTWVIHIGYVLILTRGFQRLRADVADLKRR
jgi:hypothetical protein